jgi:hypothetical protein
VTRRWIDVGRLRLRSLVRRARVESELDRELRAHLDAMIAENLERGMSPVEARRVDGVAGAGWTGPNPSRTSTPPPGSYSSVLQ